MQEGLADRLGEHALGGYAADRSDGLGADALVVRRHEQAGLGAELPGAESEGADPARGDRRAMLGSGLGGDEDGVDAAELAVERDRARPVGRKLGEGETTALAAGEGDRLDAVVVDEVDAVLELVRHHGEHAARRAGVRKRLLRDRHDRVTEAGVARIGLHHDGAARRECRRRVSTERRESEGEVGCGEDGDRAEGDVDAAQVGPRRCHIDVGMVDDDTEEGSVSHDLSHEAQLAGRATDLAGEAIDAETAFLDGDGHEVITRGINRVCDGLEETRARLQVRIGVPLLGRLRCRACLADAHHRAHATPSAMRALTTASSHAMPMLLNTLEPPAGTSTDFRAI